MAGSRPPVLPTWSTTANYPAGGSDWSGKATRVQPSAPVAAQGLIPATGLAAEYINWLFGAGGDFLTYLDSWWNPPLVGSNLPQLRFLDAAGNGRYLVDHNGYPIGGKIDTWREEWLVQGSSFSAGAMAGSTAGFSATPGTGGSVVLTSPLAGYNGSFITLNTTTTSGAGTFINTPQFCFANTAGMSLVIEMDVGLNAAACGVASKTTFYFGLSTATDIIGSTDNNLVCLLKRYNQANYQTIVGNGTLNGINNTSPTATPTSTTFPADRLKIELHGASSPFGAIAKFFVNEVLVGSVSGAGNLPASVPLRATFYAYAENGVPVGSPIVYVGPITCCWNRYLSGPNL